MTAGTWARQGRELGRRSRRRDRLHMELEPGCCSGDTRLLEAEAAAATGRPASGVAATMMQNVGNHLRRVWRDWKERGGD